MKDARPLDELAHDLTTNHVLNDDTLDTPRIDTIIQRCHPAGARQRRKPGAEARLRISDDLSHEHIGPLRAAPEAALPHQLDVFARVVRFER